MATVNASVTATLACLLEQQESQASDKSDFRVNVGEALVPGTLDEQVNLAYYDRVTLSPSGTLNIDLSGSLLDRFGDAVVFVKVRAIIIHNRSDEQATPTTAQVNVVGNFITTRYGASTAIPLPVGSVFLHSIPKTGLTVTATSADVITLSNQDATNGASLDVIVAGTNA